MLFLNLLDGVKEKEKITYIQGFFPPSPTKKEKERKKSGTIIHEPILNEGYLTVCSCFPPLNHYLDKALSKKKKGFIK